MTSVILQNRLIALQKEIEALKSASRLPSRLRSYSASVWCDNDGTYMLPSSTWAGGWKIKITYESGKNDIISEFISPVNAWTQVPIGDTQEVHLFAQWVGFYFVIVTTRPIVSVEFLTS